VRHVPAVSEFLRVPFEMLLKRMQVLKSCYKSKQAHRRDRNM